MLPCHLACVVVTYSLYTLINFRYNGANHSNMALLDFEVPSGYVYQSWNYVSEEVNCCMYSYSYGSVNCPVLYILLTIAIDKCPANRPDW